MVNKQYIAVLQKKEIKAQGTKNKSSKTNVYLTVLLRVYDFTEGNKVEVSGTNWLIESQIVAVQDYEPLNFSIKKGRIVEDKGDFSRFNKGANLIIVRKLVYDNYTSYVVLMPHGNGVTSKEILEQQLINLYNSKKTPIVQNAIIKNNSVACYENAPFDTINIESKVKKKPISKKKEFADLGLSNNPTTEMPDSLVESIYSSIPEANSDLLYDILRYELTTKYNATKIVQGKEKALEVDNNIEFIVDYMLTQLTPYTNELSNTKKNVMKKNCLEWFAPIKNNKVLYNKVEKAFS